MELIVWMAPKGLRWYTALLHDQDPLRASDKALTSCGPYKMKEEDAMVYRRPYLTSGSSGFALNAISRNMNKDLKVKIYVYWIGSTGLHVFSLA